MNGRSGVMVAGMTVTGMLAAVLTPVTGVVDLRAQVAQDVRQIGLQEALELVLDRNRDIVVARTGLVEAEERVSEAWSAVYPSVSFSGGYTRNISPQVSFLPAEFFPGSGDGGDEFVAVQFGADNTWQSNVSLEQPLFRAGAFIGVSAAGRYEELQEEVLRGSVQTTVTEVRIAYYDLLLAQEEVRLTENSLARVRASLEETRALNEAGLASDYDVLRLEVELANLEPQLRTARNRVARTRRDLALQLDMEESENLAVEGSLAELNLDTVSANSPENRQILTLTGVEIGESLDTAALVDRARSGRTDVLQAEATADLRQAELRVQQMEYLPEISLVGNYSIQAQQNGDPDFFGTGNTRAYSRSVGLQVSVPVFTGFQRDAAIDQRRAVLRGARVQAQVARDRARNQVLGFLDDVGEARIRADAQGLAVRQARRGYEIAEAEYTEGIAGRLQLTDAEVALRQSEFNYAQAVFDYLVARANLDRAVGEVPVADGPTE
ncbi:MAG: TolC family protein [Gemmatimonadota bacterium]